MSINFNLQISNRFSYTGKRALFLIIAVLMVAGLHVSLLAGGAMAGTGEGTVPDFSVETANGPFQLSEKKGKTLIYFFSFPG